MNSYVAGDDVTLTVPLVDRNGNAISPTAVTYSVLDQDGNVLVASTPVVGFVSGSGTATITVPGALNALPQPVGNAALDPTNLAAAREIQIVCTVSGSPVRIEQFYVLTPQDRLVEGVNSCQSYVQALMTAAGMSDIPGWTAATDSDRMNALLEAKIRIYKVPYRPYIGIVDQNNEQYVPDSTYTSGIMISDPRFFASSLELVSQQQFLLLPTRFKTALRLAQVAEANHILGADPIQNLRDAGVLSDQAGETKQTFKSSRPLNLVICRRAMMYLGGFLDTSYRTNRR